MSTKMRGVFVSVWCGLVVVLTGCSGYVGGTSTPAGPVITFDPFGSPSATPFRPVTWTMTASIEPQPVTPTNAAFNPTATFTPLPAVPNAVPGERTRYEIIVSLDYSDRTLHVDEAIVYTNNTGESLSTLLLSVLPNRQPGVFVLDSLNLDGQVMQNYTLSGQKLEIALEQTLQAGAAITLSVSFDLYLPYSGTTNVFGYNNVQMNLVDWYPFVVPYVSGQGWLLHDPCGVGEHLVYDSADFNVTIRLVDSSQDITIAAAAPGTQDGDSMRFTLYNSRTFSFSASTKYLVSTASVGSVVVSSYYFPEHEAAGEAILQAAAQAVAVYGSRYASPPYPSLNIVEIYYVDGLEVDGMVFLSNNFYASYDGKALNNLISIGVHEVSHQWWFGLVGNDQALEPWLDEALATYSERIFYEHVYPSLAAAWWNFRVRPFNPAGYVDISIYEGGSFRPYVNAVYLRGAYFMDDLRWRVGEDVFYAFLQDYASQMAHRRATAQDFFNILNQHTRVDYSDILRDYFQDAP